MLRRILAVAVSIVGCTLSGQDVFAAQEGAKIGVINVQKIVRESKAGKDALATFEKDMQAKRATLKAREEAAQKLEAEIKAGADKMQQADRQAKEESFMKEVRDLRRFRQDLEEELKKIDAELTQKVTREIVDVTRAVAAEQRYTVILQAGPQVVYVDKSADITDEVIKRYDSQAKK